MNTQRWDCDIEQAICAATCLVLCARAGMLHANNEMNNSKHRLKGIECANRA